MPGLINAFIFHPFASRSDDAVGLRFTYNAKLVGELKSILRPLHEQQRRRNRHCKNAGGWLDDEHCWYVELPVWPVVRRQLEELGYKIRGDVPDAEESDFSSNSSDRVSPRREVHNCLKEMMVQYSAYYELGVWPGAPPEVIDSAYRALAKLLHPDIRGHSTTERMVKINAAYEKLKSKRR